MGRTIVSICILFFINISLGVAQKESYYKRVFVDAEYYVLYEEYRDALPLYKELYKAGRNNANINYRIGQCYLNIPGEKEKAILFLQKAITDINPAYKEGYFTETGAPRQAFLFLGNAYRVAGDLQKAKEAYEKYQQLLRQEEKREQIIIANNLKSVEMAMSVKPDQIQTESTNLGNNINTSFPEVRPTISGNSSVLAYTSIQRFYSAVFISRLGAKEQWIPAKNVTAEVNAEGSVFTSSLSFDGNILFFTRSELEDFNIYMSRYDTTLKKWGAMERLNKNINSKAAEMAAFLSKDGKTLYFSSNREGGQGGFDLYKSTLGPNNEWGEAVNLGPEINTMFDEDCPALSEDEKTLFFSSNGHPGYGGIDIFSATVNGNNYQGVKNIGFGSNTTDDDIYFCPTDNGNQVLIARPDANGFGDYDLIKVKLAKP